VTTGNAKKKWRCKVHRQCIGDTKRFPYRYRKFTEIIEWRENKLVCAAQAIPAIETEIAKKSRSGTETTPKEKEYEKNG
jgi:hypothetical protein